MPGPLTCGHLVTCSPVQGVGFATNLTEGNGRFTKAEAEIQLAPIFRPQGEK